MTNKGKKKKPSQTAKDKEKQDVIQTSFTGPALLVNRSVVFTTSAGLRIGFIEKAGKDSPAQFRTAVIIPFQDALSLHKLMEQHLEPIRQALTETEAEESETENG